MKTEKAIVAVGGILIGAMAMAAPAFVNDICLPSSLYLLSDVQNDLFVQPFIKRWRPYDDYVRFSMNKKYGKFMRHLSTVVTLDMPVDGADLDVELINGDEFETIKRQKVTLRVGKKGAGDRDVYAQIVSDSFTHGQFFRDALLDSGYVPKLHLVGLLKCGDGQYNEGRGGASAFFTETH